MTRLLVLLLLVWPWPALAQTTPATLPTLTAPVNDFAGVIDAGASAEIDRIIRALQASTGDVIVVATVDSVAPFGSIEEYAVRLFEQAGVGTRVSDNGALIVVAVQDRKVRIEVGYGLEEFITDGYAGDVIRTEMLPEFREGRYGAGLVAATGRLARHLADKRGADLTAVPEPAAPERRGNDYGVADGAKRVVTIVILILVLINWINSHNGGGRSIGRRRGGTWSGWHGGIGGFGGGFGSGGFGGGGFGGGGFGGFGGGRSGGGGASGGW